MESLQDLDPAKLAQIVSLGIDPTYLFFFPPTFVHPKVRDPNNYEPEDQRKLLLALCFITVALASVIVAVRLLARYYYQKRLEWDDWLIIPAWFFLTGNTAVVLYGVYASRIGMHVYDIGIDQIHAFFLTQYMANFTGPAIPWFTRASILVFLRRLIPKTEPFFRRTLLGVLVLNFFWYPATVFPSTFQCAPRELKIWSMENLASGDCFRPKVQKAVFNAGISMAVLGCLLDIATLLAPIKLFWTLHMTTRRRMVLVFLFGIGLLACVASLAKAAYMGRQSNGTALYDLTWTFYPTFICGQFEGFLGILAACAPALRAVYARLHPTVSAYCASLNVFMTRSGIPTISSKSQAQAIPSENTSKTESGDHFNMNHQVVTIEKDIAPFRFSVNDDKADLGALNS